MADRTRRFLLGLGTGYLSIAANIVYTLISIPLALHFLTKEEFGLWVLVAQLTSYMNLVDLGMQSSVARIFINYKDKKGGDEYGSFIRTSFYIFSAQGFAVLLLGLSLVPLLERWLSLPEGGTVHFQELMALQLLILALGFTTRTLSCLLHAHQHFIWANLGGAGGLLGGLVGMSFAFHSGWGVFSLSAAGGVAVLFNALIQLLGCVHQHLLPKAGVWGAFQPRKGAELFSFAKETFLIALGWQLISASPTILISKLAGLEAAATWSVGTKLLTLFQQFIWRIFDFASSGLSEMFARGERENLRKRFFQITSATAILSILLAGIVAFANSRFVSLWTADKIFWPPSYDILLAFLLFSCSFNRCHGGFLVVSMNIGFGKYIYLLDGLFFCFFAAVTFPFLGMAGFICVALCMDFCFPGLYGWWRSSHFFGQPVFVVLKNSFQNCKALSCIVLISVAAVLLFFTYTPLNWFTFFVGLAFYLTVVCFLGWVFGFMGVVRRLLATL